MNGNTSQVKKTKRLMNVELLRILSMFFIVCNHFLGHGLGIEDYNFDDPNRFVLWFFRGLCYTGTNLFVIISAYFQCKSRFRLNGLLQLIYKVLFYSIIIYFISVLCGLTEFSYSSAVRSFTPIISASYWFITCYVALCFLAPFINSLMSSLPKEQFKALILILFVFLSVIPNFFFNSTWLNWGGSCGIVWFVFLYMVAGYIREYVDIRLIPIRNLLLVLLLFLFLPLITKIIIANLSQILIGHVVGSSIFFSNNSVLVFPLSVLIFLTFLKINVSGNGIMKFIAFVSSSIFAVYLISEHPSISMRLWNFCAQIVEHHCSLIPIFIIVIPITIMVSCILIDQIRKFFFLLIAKTVIPQKIEGYVSKYISKLFTDL